MNFKKIFAENSFQNIALIQVNVKIKLFYHFRCYKINCNFSRIILLKKIINLFTSWYLLLKLDYDKDQQISKLEYNLYYFHLLGFRRLETY